MYTHAMQTNLTSTNSHIACFASVADANPLYVLLQNFLLGLEMRHSILVCLALRLEIVRHFFNRLAEALAQDCRTEAFNQVVKS